MYIIKSVNTITSLYSWQKEGSNKEVTFIICIWCCKFFTGTPIQIFRTFSMCLSFFMRSHATFESFAANVKFSQPRRFTFIIEQHNELARWIDGNVIWLGKKHKGHASSVEFVRGSPKEVEQMFETAAATAATRNALLAVLSIAAADRCSREATKFTGKRRLRTWGAT